jgi:hypothetical protein
MDSNDGSVLMVSVLFSFDGEAILAKPGQLATVKSRNPPHTELIEGTQTGLWGREWG